MPTGQPLTQAQRQEIITLRQDPHNCSYKEIVARTGRPYNTIAAVCQRHNLQKQPTQAITIVHDPNNIYKLGLTELNQADFAYMLAYAALPNGFTFTIGSHTITTQNGIYFRDDGRYCPPNKSGQLIWYRPEGAE